jgi:hypothetical protein
MSKKDSICVAIEEPPDIITLIRPPKLSLKYEIYDIMSSIGLIRIALSLIKCVCWTRIEAKSYLIFFQTNVSASLYNGQKSSAAMPFASYDNSKCMDEKGEHNWDDVNALMAYPFDDIGLLIPNEKILPSATKLDIELRREKKRKKVSFSIIFEE